MILNMNFDLDLKGNPSSLIAFTFFKHHSLIFQKTAGAETDIYARFTRLGKLSSPLFLIL